MPLADAADPEPRQPVRVLIVDDEAFPRNAIPAILGPYPEIDVIGAVDGGAAAVEFARAHRPDVVLMDIQMPGMDGIEATRALLAQVDANIAAMTSIADLGTVRRMFEAGAYGYILKDTDPGDMARAVLTVARGDAFLAPQHTRQIVVQLAADSGAEARREAAALFSALTEREREAARLIATGASDDEIARAMHLGVSTVKTHVQQARIKLGARNRTQVAVLVERAGETPAGV